ncbi:MAG TPA: cobalamin B12-binding domain-containing protein [Nevskiaceae bacterium]|nr:cobalamin B12-binding domain-containing protein [Nevskiaceae bacterium]
MAALLAGRRILVAKPGLDGHDVGAKVVALALRDAGAEVIYTGLRRSAEEIAQVALQEDVDAIGLSILSGSHCELVEQVLAALDAAGIGGIPLFLGGTIPAEDRPRLAALGVQGIFTSDMPLDEVVSSLARSLKL